jgi:hypothetical protein
MIKGLARFQPTPEPWLAARSVACRFVSGLTQGKAGTESFEQALFCVAKTGPEGRRCD